MAIDVPTWVRLVTRRRVTPARCWGAPGRVRGLLVFLIASAAAISTSGCSKPTLNAVVPSTGYPRQLLAVDGETFLAGVVWDVGLPTETILYNGLFGTSYFQIPTNATQGSHPVAIKTNSGTSNTVQVNVLKFHTFPAPRIEDVGIVAVDGGGPVDVALTVAAANLDVDATLTVAEIVNGAPVAKTSTAPIRWGAIPVDYLQQHKPDTFGYPIYHYVQLISVVDDAALGSTLRITVTNTDGLTDITDFRLPNTLANWDSDGDGLLDSWEENTYTAPSGNRISLSGMGANKWRKDILVEVDWINAAKPQNTIWQSVEAIFQNAPVLNPDGSRGVNIIIDRGQGGAFTNGGQTLVDHDCLTYGPPPASIPGCQNIKGFFDYKATNFDADRLLIFHYAVFGRGDFEGYSGRGERHGNDFFVTLLGSGVPPGLLGAQVGSFVHELGHNLGFSHGDLLSDDQNYPLKPNLPSVMNYLYTLGGDYDCDLKKDGPHSYSQGSLARLDEGLVNETVGVCDGKPVDLNGDGDALDVGAMNLNPGDGTDPNTDADTLDQWDDFDQWGNLLLDFDAPGSNWGNN